MNEHIKRNGIQVSLNDYGVDTSIYDIGLLSSISNEDLYVLTSEGKIQHGALKDTTTGEKFVIDKSKFRIIVDEDNTEPFCQIVVILGVDVIDARGSYARSLEVVSKRK